MPTDISTALPDVVLTPGCTVEVTLSDANGDVTQLNVYTYSPGHSNPLELPPVEPLLAFAPAGASP